jgi:IS30 family transposase
MLLKQKLGQTNVTTLVERVSRFTVILKNPDRRTKPVMGKIIKAIKDLPHKARRSITFDRGSEFMNWPHLQAEIGTQTWFCDPTSPLSADCFAIACQGMRGKKEPSRTQTDGLGAGCRVSGTSDQ